MFIETTIHIDRKLLEKLNNASSSCNLSRSTLITLLVKKIIAHKKLPTKSFKRLQYQKRKPKHCWKKLHVVLSVSAYENCCDLRKFFKLSVSRCIAEAITTYLDEIERNQLKEKDPQDITDNYPDNYIIISNECDTIYNFNVFWGIPSGKILEKYLE